MAAPVTSPAFLPSPPPSPASAAARPRRHQNPIPAARLVGDPAPGPPAAAVPLARRRLRPLRPALAEARRRAAARTALVVGVSAVGNGRFVCDRHVLVEWMVDVCGVFAFKPTTLHAAARHEDGFMSRRALPQAVWQLCTVACC